MDDIQSLTDRIRDLSESVDFWNVLMLWGLGLAAVAAVFVVIATRIVVSQSGKLSVVQSELVAAKDRKLQKDLADKTVEIGNLKIASDAADAQVFGLQTTVENAKATQQRVEIDLAKEQEKAANAERMLLELQERVKIRHLTAEQRKKLIDFLKAPNAVAVMKGPIKVARLLLDESAQPFAVQIRDALDASGWPSGDIEREMMEPNTEVPVGIIVEIRDMAKIPPHAGLIRAALEAAGLEPTIAVDPNTPDGQVNIFHWRQALNSNLDTTAAESREQGDRVVL